jgi:hypothetical protein
VPIFRFYQCHITLKEIMGANPKMDPEKLKVRQGLQDSGANTAVADASAAVAACM